jgi:hypothetical protein
MNIALKGLAERLLWVILTPWVRPSQRSDLPRTGRFSASAPAGKTSPILLENSLRASTQELFCVVSPVTYPRCEGIAGYSVNPAEIVLRSDEVASRHESTFEKISYGIFTAPQIRVFQQNSPMWNGSIRTWETSAWIDRLSPEANIRCAGRITSCRCEQFISDHVGPATHGRGGGGKEPARD